MHQDDVIKRFVHRLNEVFGTTHAITDWPDKDPKVNGGIDAYAEGPGSIPWAIEHTLVETYSGQKQDDHRFSKVLSGLGAEVGPVPDHLTLAFPSLAVQPGIEWQQLRADLVSWLRTEIRSLPLGMSSHRVPGVPFPLTVFRHESPKPGIFEGRFSPAVLGEVASMRKALTKKKGKLEEYSPKAKSILLLESEDFALTNHANLYMAYLQAVLDIHHQIDEVWLAEICEPAEGPALSEFVCFHGSAEVMAAANPEHYGIHPDFTDYWWGEIEKAAGGS